MIANTMLLRGRKSLAKEVLSLEEFVFRQKVLQTYRTLMRAVYKHHEKQGLAEFAKQEFKATSAGVQLSLRKYLLEDGIRRINSMILPLKGNIKV